MNKLWSDLTKGLQHEQSLGEERVGEGQALTLEDEIVVEE